MDMKKTDLGELYALLEMYSKTYGGVPDTLLSAIADAYEKQGGNGTLRNPRGAGRRPSVTAEQTKKAKDLRAAGCTIRDIADKIGVSIGSVQKLISEQ